MKALYITQAFMPTGASDTFSRELVKELSGRGVEMDVLTFGSGDFDRRDEFNGSNIYRFPVKGHHALYKFQFPLWRGLGRKLFDKEDYDIVHSQELFPGWIGDAIARKHDVPHILVKEMASNYPGLHGRTVLLSERLSLPFLKYDRLVSWSRYMVEEYFQQWGVNEDKTDIIPGGIRLDDIPEDVDSSKVREEYGIGDGPLLVVTKPFYRTNALAISRIIRAVKNISKEHPETELLIAGDGEYRNIIEETISDTGLEDSVHLPGYVEHSEALRLQAAADLLPHYFVYAPTTSIALLESMASGTPIISTNTGEVQYILEDCGFLAGTDISSYSDTLSNAIESQEKTDLAEKAKKRIEERYTIEAVADSYMELYEREAR